MFRFLFFIVCLLEWLPQKASLRESVVPLLADELENLGVLSVQELAGDDWRGLTVWSSLQPFERRRVLKVTGCA